MTRRSSQSGEGNIGCIVWAVVLGIVLMIGWKAVPVKIKSAELYDFIDEQARHTKIGAEERVTNIILGKALELELPLDADHLKVERKGDNVTIEYSYTVDLEFPGYTYAWDFEGEIKRAVFVY